MSSGRVAALICVCVACSSATAGPSVLLPAPSPAPAQRAIPLEPNRELERAPGEPAKQESNALPQAVADEAPFDENLSTSIGHPADGRLEGGVALPNIGPGFRFNDRRESVARYATAEVINAIISAAKSVQAEEPPAELVVNDLSLERGGPIDHHGSHRAGRDADILFYLLGDDQKPITSVGAPIDPEGIGFDYKDLAIKDDDVRVRFDAQRTWRFIAGLLSNERASVQRIFVVEHLRSRLLEEATRAHADRELRERFAEISCQPAYPHDDHLHVRWFCSPEDMARGCRDLPPVYPWREQALRALGLEPLLGVLRSEREKSKITTHADEDRAVQKMRIHPDVHAFLARRKKWRDQPHPGRKYCP